MNSIWNLFWIFIVIVSLLPMIQKRMMENRRLALMRKLEVRRNSRVITLIHRQETMKFLGFPLLRTHDYPITSEEAKTLGLPISTDLPEEIYQLMDLFPQASAQRPSVQYIPVPYKKVTGKPAEK